MLSTFLNGDNITVFLGCLLLSKMETGDVDAIFQTHADFVSNIQSLSLSLAVQNLDRVQTEYKKEGNTMRTAWEWAITFTDSEGSGDNKRAQLLVPADKIEHGLATFTRM